MVFLMFPLELYSLIVTIIFCHMLQNLQHMHVCSINTQTNEEIFLENTNEVFSFRIVCVYFKGSSIPEKLLSFNGYNTKRCVAKGLVFPKNVI